MNRKCEECRSLMVDVTVRKRFCSRCLRRHHDKSARARKVRLPRVRGRICKQCQRSDSVARFDPEMRSECSACARAAARNGRCQDCRSPLYRRTGSGKFYCPKCDPEPTDAERMAVVTLVAPGGRERVIYRRLQYSINVAGVSRKLSCSTDPKAIVLEVDEATFDKVSLSENVSVRPGGFARRATA